MKTLNSIEDVVQELDGIIAWSVRENSPLGYFACTYRSMTLAVSDAVKKKKFEDGKRMITLDLAFATRYLEAFENFRNGHKCTNAWFTAFEAAENKNLLIMQHILLGINAHINLDLGVSAASIMPYRKIAPLKNDFNKINEVIASINQKVQDSLSKICYPVELIDEISQGQDNVILDFAISRARETSWAGAFVLSNAATFIRPTLINMIDNAATLVARNIIVSTKTPANLLQKLKSCESGDVGHNIKILSDTKL
ncbi:DUF5995 family protein [Kaistella palustris]|uniref:DUF5995 family protein n=1 Tax=Kaistella palustris TaxID=493376 RepID=UPI000418103F|nr:DUF5995 family protein [Kaistella palustris]